MQFDELIDVFIMPKTIQAIGRFTITWNLFEHNYMNNNGGEDIIKKLHFERIDEENMKVLNDLVESFRHAVADYYGLGYSEIDANVVRKRFYPSNVPKNNKHVTEIKEFLNAESNDVKGCFYAICRIRNNMLHGEKDIYCIDGQINMIHTASEVLAFMNKDEMSEYREILKS